MCWTIYTTIAYTYHSTNQIEKTVHTWREDCWSSWCDTHLWWVDWNLNDNNVIDSSVSNAIHSDASNHVSTKLGVRVINVVNVSCIQSCNNNNNNNAPIIWYNTYFVQTDSQAVALTVNNPHCSRSVSRVRLHRPCKKDQLQHKLGVTGCILLTSYLHSCQSFIQLHVVFYDTVDIPRIQKWRKVSKKLDFVTYFEPWEHLKITWNFVPHSQNGSIWKVAIWSSIRARNYGAPKIGIIIYIIILNLNHSVIILTYLITNFWQVNT